MEFNNKYPIYKQLYDIFVKEIITKKLKPGDKFISIREAASKYNLNPNTIVNTFKELEKNNVAITKRGFGTFVTEDLDVIENLISNHFGTIVDEFLEKMISLGYSKEEIISIINERMDKNA